MSLSYAARIDTIAVYSEAMSKNITNIAIIPDTYVQDSSRNYPVIYLLHGAMEIIPIGLQK